VGSGGSRRSRGDARRRTRRNHEPGSSSELRSSEAVEEAGTPGEHPVSATRKGPARDGRWTGARTPRGPGEGRDASGPKAVGVRDCRREAARSPAPHVDDRRGGSAVCTLHGERRRRAHPRLRGVAPRAVREARAHARGDRAGHEGPEHRFGAKLWRGAPRGEQRPLRGGKPTRGGTDSRTERGSEVEEAGERRVIPADEHESAGEAFPPSTAGMPKRTLEPRGEPGHRAQTCAICAGRRVGSRGNPGDARLGRRTRFAGDQRRGTQRPREG
jgi:hypothetical protein